MKPKKPEDALAKADLPFDPPKLQAHMPRPNALKVKPGNYKLRMLGMKNGMTLAPIDREPIPIPYKTPRCGAPLSSKGIYQGDGFCRMPAGWNTNHLGDGPCKHHGGNHKRIEIKLVREMIMANIKQGIYGDPQEIDPDTALLMEVHRTAGHVEWLRQHIREIGERKGDGVLTQYTDAFGISPSVWVDMYQKERQHLVRVAKAAIDTGISKRQVEIAETQARMLAMVMVSFIEDQALGLDYMQKLNARKLMRKHLEQAQLHAATVDIDDTAEMAQIMDDAIELESEEVEVFD